MIYRDSTLSLTVMFHDVCSPSGRAAVAINFGSSYNCTLVETKASVFETQAATGRRIELLLLCSDFNQSIGKLSF